jgi:hypothetical protein
LTSFIFDSSLVLDCGKNENYIKELRLISPPLRLLFA